MRMFQPFWEKRYIRGETVVFAEEKGEITGHLAFENPHSLKLFSRSGILLKENQDYERRENKIVLLNPSFPYFREGWLQNVGVPNNVLSENKDYGIEGCLLVSPPYLRTMQFIADYLCDETKFPEVLPDKIRLNRTYQTLKEKRKLKFALYGDSVCNAANSSWEMRFCGYKHWMEESLLRAEKFYGAKIEFLNFSRSGYGTERGIDAVTEKFGALQIDLVVIGLGGNDAPTGMPLDKYIENVREIMRRIRKRNPETEFILLSPTPQNPECKQIYRRDLIHEYIIGLKTLVDEGVTTVNLDGVYSFLLKRKRYCEFSGNNLNHPNDFWYQFYTDAFTELFYRLKIENEF